MTGKIIGIHCDDRLLTATRENGETVWRAPYRNAAEHLLSLPRDALCFAFDTMRIATRVFESEKDPFNLWMIFHPEIRRRYYCPQCQRKWLTPQSHCPGCKSAVNMRTPLHRVRCASGLIQGYTADRDGFTVAEGPPKRWARSRRVWNAMGFTHKGLEESLESFGIRENDKALATALLMRRVLTILGGAGIEIKGQYRGAGSSAGTLMRKHGVAAHRGPSQSDIAETNPDLARAIMSADFGGREEIAVMGAVRGPLYEYDLASAYPRAMNKLPCLACGTWGYGVHKLFDADLALVRYRVGVPREHLAWAPLPCRTEDGPVWAVNHEGWGYWGEVQAAMRRHPGLIEVLEAWAYTTTCRHRPFAFLTSLRRKRLKLTGGDADLLKTAAAAVFGKVGQRITSPVQSFIWAGATASAVRARVLEVLDDRVVSVATDAILSREPLKLGEDWRFERHARAFLTTAGMFADAEDANGRRIVNAARRGADKVNLRENVFVDGRAGTTAMIRCRKCGLNWDFVGGWQCPVCKIVGGVPKAAKAARYGQTITRTREVSLDTLPMRERYETSALTGKCRQLRVRDLGGVVSLPYEPATR